MRCSSAVVGRAMTNGVTVIAGARKPPCPDDHAVCSVAAGSDPMRTTARPGAPRGSRVARREPTTSIESASSSSRSAMRRAT